MVNCYGNSSSVNFEITTITDLSSFYNFVLINFLNGVQKLCLQFLLNLFCSLLTMLPTRRNSNICCELFLHKTARKRREKYTQKGKPKIDGSESDNEFQILASSFKLQFYVFMKFRVFRFYVSMVLKKGLAQFNNSSGFSCFR